MTLEIIKNHAMASGLETNWLPIEIDGVNTFKKKQVAVSLQIFWDNVSGVLNGVIDLYQTNDLNARALVATYNINSASNRNNSILIELNPVFNSFKLNYINNGITGGNLYASLVYK